MYIVAEDYEIFLFERVREFRAGPMADFSPPCDRNDIVEYSIA